MNDEEIVMKLIVHGGDARSKSIQALTAARNHNFDEARELLELADEEINKAHEVQTALIQSELRGESQGKITLLMVHAQDHLMNAMTVRDLAKAMVEIVVTNT